MRNRPCSQGPSHIVVLIGFSFKEFDTLTSSLISLTPQTLVSLYGANAQADLGLRYPPELNKLFLIRKGHYKSQTKLTQCNTILNGTLNNHLPGPDKETRRVDVSEVIIRISSVTLLSALHTVHPDSSSADDALSTNGSGGGRFK